MYAVVNYLLNEELAMNYEEMYEVYFDSLDEGEEVLSFADFVEALS